MKATYCIVISIIINFDDYIVFFLAFIRKIRYKYYKCVFLEWGKERGDKSHRDLSPMVVLT